MTEFTVWYQGKLKSFADQETMLRRLGAESISDNAMAEIRKANRQGRSIHVGFDPYDSEINGVQSLLVAATEEELLDRQSQLGEDI